MKTATVITDPKMIALYRMATLKQMLRLECLGMKNSRGSVYAIIKNEFNLRGDKKSVYTQFSQLYEEKKAVAGIQ